jgi:hypothetical protein
MGGRHPLLRHSAILRLRRQRAAGRSRPRAAEARRLRSFRTRWGLIRPRFPGDSEEGQVVYDYSYDGAMCSMDESLARLRLGRIDIALIHDIDHWTHKDEPPRRFREALDGALSRAERPQGAACHPGDRIRGQ